MSWEMLDNIFLDAIFSPPILNFYFLPIFQHSIDLCCKLYQCLIIGKDCHFFVAVGVKKFFQFAADLMYFCFCSVMEYKLLVHK